MRAGGNQKFASPAEALAHISEAAWSNWTKADYTVEQWHAACLIHIHDGAPTSKNECKLPVKTPDGTLNRNGVHAAAAALAGARGGLKGVSAEQKKKAGNALKRYYAQLGEDSPESLTEHTNISFREKSGSPGDILEHHGVKGMKWGIRNTEDESSAKAKIQRNEVEKRNIAKINSAKSRNLSTTKKTEQIGRSDGLSDTQKKTLLAAGVGVVAIGGFIAYKHYAGGSTLPTVGTLTDWGNPMPHQPDMSGLKTHRLSDKSLGQLGKEGKHALLRRDELTLDVSKGYADWLPIDGFANETVAARHASVTRALDEMRKKYPTVRNMNIEVVPMSHAYPKGTNLSAAGMVRQLGDGEARIFYNDIRGSVTEDMSDFIPGFRDPDHLGTHEMGHILAGANGALFSSDARNRVAAKVGDYMRDDVGQAEKLYHKRLFQKHGLSFEELGKLGGYAASDPVEALAELSANYHSPRLRAKMDPELAKRAETLFNDMGGVV